MSDRAACWIQCRPQDREAFEKIGLADEFDEPMLTDGLLTLVNFEAHWGAENELEELAKEGLVFTGRREGGYDYTAAIYTAPGDGTLYVHASVQGSDCIAVEMKLDDGDLKESMRLALAFAERWREARRRLAEDVPVSTVRLPTTSDRPQCRRCGWRGETEEDYGCVDDNGLGAMIPDCPECGQEFVTEEELQRAAAG
jgi:hypothetical protein